MPQSKRILTNDKFTAGTVFVDHVSDFFVYIFQIDPSIDSAIAAKEGIERNMTQFGVTIKRYHIDNVVFASKGFVSHVEAIT